MESSKDKLFMDDVKKENLNILRNSLKNLQHSVDIIKLENCVEDFDEEDIDILSDDIENPNDVPIKEEIPAVKRKRRIQKKEIVEEQKSIKKTLRSQIKIELKVKLYKCTICGDSYENVLDLRNHIQTHDIQKLFQCSVCQLCYCDSVLLQEHVQIHLSDRNKNANFKNSRVKLNPKGKSKERKKEAVSTAKKNCLLKKKNSNFQIIKSKKLFRCKCCFRSFQTSAERDTHVKIVKNKLYKSCPICTKNILSCNLPRHIKEIHTTDRPFKCKFCAGSFNNKASLTSHLNFHSANPGEK